MLRACREVLKPAGWLAFFVLVVSDFNIAERLGCLSREEQQFMASPHPYPDMLGEAGWEVVEALDVTDAYRETAAKRQVATAEMEEDLRKVLGDEVFEEKQEDRRASFEAIEAGALGRGFYLAKLDETRPPAVGEDP